MLLTGVEASNAAIAATGDGPARREFVWNSWTVPAHVSRDGRALLLSSQDVTTPDYNVLLQRTDGTSAVKIGRGRAQSLSPDGRILWVRRTARSISIMAMFMFSALFTFTLTLRTRSVP